MGKIIDNEFNEPNLDIINMDLSDIILSVQAKIFDVALKNSPKYAKNIVKSKFAALDIIKGSFKDVGGGESASRAILSNAAGTAAVLAVAEIPFVGAPTAAIFGSKISNTANDFVDIAMGDKTKKAALSAKIQFLEKKLHKVFNGASQKFSTIGKKIGGFFEGPQKTVVKNNAGRFIIYGGVQKFEFIKKLVGMFKGKFHSGGKVPGRGDVMALLEGGETVRTEAQEKELQEMLAKRQAHKKQNQKTEKDRKESLLPRLSKEDDQYVIGLIMDAFKRNRYGFRTVLRSA